MQTIKLTKRELETYLQAIDRRDKAERELARQIDEALRRGNYCDARR